VLNYDETMRLGAHRYADALTALTKAGIHAAFTQTGGMNTAMCAVLDGGAVLLIPDAEDSLPWDRLEQSGWSAGLYPDDESQDAIAFDSITDTTVETLLALVRGVLTDGARRSRASRR